MSEALCMRVSPTLRDPALLIAFEGWNDAGEAATSAVRCVGAGLRAVPMAEIDSEEFLDFTVARPRVRRGRDDQREIDWPAYRFSFATMGEDRGIVLGTGIEPHLRWRSYSELFTRMVGELGIRQVVLVGAYLADVLYSRPVTVTGFASDSETLKRLHVNPSRYEGPTGIVGVLADRFQQMGLDVTSLWAGLPHYVNLSPNPRGSLALIQKLRELLPIRIDEAPLQRSAAEFEQRISTLVASDPELSEYVRELKRREFAQ